MSAFTSQIKNKYFRCVHTYLEENTCSLFLVSFINSQVMWYGSYLNFMYILKSLIQTVIFLPNIKILYRKSFFYSSILKLFYLDTHTHTHISLLCFSFTGFILRYSFAYAHTHTHLQTPLNSEKRRKTDNTNRIFLLFNYRKIYWNR